jgi:FixJ family two-component response regulator
MNNPSTPVYGTYQSQRSRPGMTSTLNEGVIHLLSILQGDYMTGEYAESTRVSNSAYGLSEVTVKVHRGAAMRKIGARTLACR